MPDDNEKKLKRRMDRELRFISANDKLRYAALAVLGGPLLLLINGAFILSVIDVFNPEPGFGVVTVAAFAVVMGIAALGADYWLLRWLKEEFNVFRWAGSSRDE